MAKDSHPGLSDSNLPAPKAHLHCSLFHYTAGSVYYKFHRQTVSAKGQRQRRIRSGTDFTKEMGLELSSQEAGLYKREKEGRAQVKTARAVDPAWWIL